ncbi:MAG: hypothetical protein ACK4M4_00765 [Flavobacterium sp.]
MIFWGNNIIQTQNENLKLKTAISEKALALEQKNFKIMWCFLSCSWGLFWHSFYTFKLKRTKKREKGYNL